MKTKLYVLMLITLLYLSACGPVPTVTPPATLPASTVSSPLPDLAISNVYLDMQGRTGNCVPGYTAYEIRATLQNLGQVPAYSIPVIERSTGTLLQVGELGGGQSME